MTNIWEFLLQTAEVTITAAILLIIKWLFADKLSPRWQYTVWILLACKILLPARLMGRYLSVTLAAGIEAIKMSAESTLSSAYSQQWIPIGQNASVFPFVNKTPESVTDWLFVLYVMGVLISLFFYGLSYVRLRRILRRSKRAEEVLMKKVEDVCERYALSGCDVVTAEGITSAFVCGFFRPLLVIPAGTDIDEKVLLHELLHRTYADALQNVFWCILRALHWCNPFLQYVFHRIGNDMESLCDQRVLEELEGEERRAYGKILLSMTGEKYARAPGTTSISNGGKNIKRRIEAIAHFKKYPRGMALVSVCALIVLAAPIFAGSEASGYETDYPDLSEYRSKVMMAEARMNGCTTPAGAIDTWVKGKVFNLPNYLAAVMPCGQQEELQRQVEKGTDFSSDISHGLKGVPFSDYAVYNLQKENEHCYTALVVIEGQEGYETQPVLTIPLRLEEDNDWTVTQSGKMNKYKSLSGPGIYWGFEELPGAVTSEGKGKTGIIRIKEQTVRTVDNQIQNQEDLFADMMGNGYFFDVRAKRSAEFSMERTFVWGSYKDSRSKSDRQAVKMMGMMAAVVKHMSDDISEDLIREEYLGQETSGSSSDGVGYDFRNIEQPWDGSFSGVNLLLWGSSDRKLSDFEGFETRLYQNGELLDTLRIKRGAKL